jgi:predicted MarR family transcription regulator
LICLQFTARNINANGRGAMPKKQTDKAVTGIYDQAARSAASLTA